ncbi:MAG: S49 family peptidase [Candidatus Jacksonbacteria bacterium]|nr:S49 family peptidase [Candidatus Jacksonbacteria bacterium]
MFLQSIHSSVSPFKIVAWVMIGLTIAMLWIEFAARLTGTEEFAVNDDLTGKTCNTARIALHGPLSTYEDYLIDPSSGAEFAATSADSILWSIRESERDDSIKAIIFEIDSLGGYPVAAEEVADALKRAQKPTVALVRNAATSGAYWAATGADRIFASSNSDVGGIGVTMSYLENAERNTREGVTYQQISSGKFKDYGDPNKPLTEEERILLLRDTRIVHENFIRAVVKNRRIPADVIRSLADGSSMLGAMAKEKGLIDAIGGIEEAARYLSKTIGEPAEICWGE